MFGNESFWGRGTPVLGSRLLVVAPAEGHPLPALSPLSPVMDGAGRPRRRQDAHAAVLAGAIVLSVVVHWAAFRYGPVMTADPTVRPAEVLLAIDLPPEVEIPPAPAGIARPAVPVAATVPVSEDITIAPTTFLANPPVMADLAPPREEALAEAAADEPTFTPFTTAPRLSNGPEAARAIAEAYPRTLRAAGIGGRVMMWFYIDATGKVVRTRVAKGSGHAQLDEAAVGVAPLLAFSPAANRDVPVPVWVQIPIVFNVTEVH